MCVTRVGKILSVHGTRAMVKILDGDTIPDVDVSMVDARKNAYVEIFADSAIGRLTKQEAEWKRELRAQLVNQQAA